MGFIESKAGSNRDLLLSIVRSENRNAYLVFDRKQDLILLKDKVAKNFLL